MRCTLLICPALIVGALVSGLLCKGSALTRPEGYGSVERDERVRTPKFAQPATAAHGDTTWIVEWMFDNAGDCDASDWQAVDGRVLNDGSNHWDVGTAFDAMGGIENEAAILSEHNLCWAFPDGYGNEWDYAIVCRYVGPGATISFDYLLDSEAGHDFLLVEADSSCSSNTRIDYTLNPAGAPGQLRPDLFTDSGLNTSGSVASLSLPDFAAPADTHCVYIRFSSDISFSPQDGFQPTSLGAALVVDNLQVGGALTYSEDFEGASLNPNVELLNSAPDEPFGLWARLFQAVTDNDPCTSNPTCAWIFSDPTLPAYTPGMAFGPDGAVIRNWLDNTIISPWVSLGSTQNAFETYIDYRRFFGNAFDSSRIVEGLTVWERTRIDDTDTPAPGDSLDCAGPLSQGLSTLWSAPTSFTWARRTQQVLVDPAATHVQVRFRITDWQWIAGSGPPSPLDTGPGPFLDDVRIGRRVSNGPLFQVPGRRGVGQDNFPTEQLPNGHFEPSDDRFGSSDFAQPHRHLVGSVGGGPGPGNWFITRDSVDVIVSDVRGAGGVTSVDFYGAVVSGPHTGKAPPPLTVGPSGFFHVTADTVRNAGGPVPDYWFVDLDDDYFRGGDRLVYFWMATDAGGGVSSHPAGISLLPGSIAEAETITGGLLETSFLPTIDWDPAYLARIAADPSGKLEPTPAELNNSSQQTCILYVSTNFNVRRSGDIHRTSFMYTLDQLGYRGKYDVFDHMLATSSSNNPLGTRATVNAATGYALIVADAPDGGSYLAIPHGMGGETFFPQSQWYQQWLAQGASSEVGRAALWVMGDDMAEDWIPVTNHVVGTEMGVTLVSDNLGIGRQPEVQGLDSFTWADDTSTDFSSDFFVLDAARTCSFFAESYDALGATGTASVTHRYQSGTTIGDGAIVMNADGALGWNTVFMSINWADIRRPLGGPPGTPETNLARRILDGVLPEACRSLPDPTTDPLADEHGGLPRATALLGNAPNPFNPTTTIRFELAHAGHVDLRVYDVSGQLVRTLVNRTMPRAHHQLVWDGRDDAGTRVASGIYVLRLSSGDFEASDKLVVVR